MSQKAREYEAAISRVLVDAGAKIEERSVDGSGHKTVSFTYNGQRSTFHYPTSGATNGRTLTNCKARLKRLLRDIPPPEVPEPTPEALTGPVVEAVALRPPPTPPSTKRLSKERRKEIVKRYLSLPSVAALEAEFAIPEDKLVNILLSSRGDAVNKYRRELARNRTLAKQRLRADLTPRPAPAAKIELDEETERRIYVHWFYGVKPKWLGPLYRISALDLVRIITKWRVRMPLDNR